MVRAVVAAYTEFCHDVGQCSKFFHCINSVIILYTMKHVLISSLLYRKRNLNKDSLKVNLIYTANRTVNHNISPTIQLLVIKIINGPFHSPQFTSLPSSNFNNSQLLFVINRLLLI
jgi:hypothetical protein